MTNGNIKISKKNSPEVRLHSRSDGYPLGLTLKIIDAIDARSNYKRNVPLENRLISTNMDCVGIGYDAVEADYSYDISLKESGAFDQIIVRENDSILCEEPMIEFLACEVQKEQGVLNRNKEYEAYIMGIELYMDKKGEIYTGVLKDALYERYVTIAKSFKEDNPNRAGYFQDAEALKKLVRVL